MRTTILSITMAALLSPSVALSQTGGAASTRIQTGAETIAETDLEQDGAMDAGARIQAAVIQALSVGIPVTLLENKIAEGRAKGIPMDRIAAAVEHRVDVLTRVRAALESRTDPVAAGELTAAADAHEAGVTLEGLAELSSRARSGERVTALTVLADLVASGRAPEHALLRVEAALSGGVAELARLEGSAALGLQVRTVIDAGARPEAPGFSGSTVVGAAGGSRGSIGIRVGGRP